MNELGLMEQLGLLYWPIAQCKYWSASASERREPY